MENNRTSRISAWQLTILLIMSRVSVMLTRPATFCNNISARDVVLGNLISVGIILLLCKLLSGKKVQCMQLSTVTLSILIVLFLLFAMMATLSFLVFYQAESEIIFPAVILIFLLMSVVWFGVLCGIEGLARFAPVVGVTFTIILVFMLLANSARMNIANLNLAHSTVGNAGVLKVVVANILLCPEIPAYFVLRRFVCKEDAEEPVFRRFYVIQAVILMLFAPAQEMVFGSFTRLQSYPIYSLALVGEFSIFQRLDVIHLGLWTLVIVVRLGMLVIAATTAVSDLRRSAPHNLLNIGAVLIVSVGALLLIRVFVTNPQFVEMILIALLIAALTAAVLTGVWQGIRERRNAS